MLRIVFIFLVALALVLGPTVEGALLGLGNPAMAQDDDDDNGGGNDDDDDGGGDDDDDDDDGGRDDDDDDGRRRGAPGAGAGSDARPEGRQNRARVQRERRPDPGPVFSQNELIVTGVGIDDLPTLAGLGYAIIETREIDAIDGLSVRVIPPAGRTLTEAQAELQGIVPQATSDFNHYYRTESAHDCIEPHCAAHAQINWPLGDDDGAAALSCDPGGTIGMIDTGINAGHAAFDQGRIEVVRLAPEDLGESGQQHGTAVASILIGEPQSRSPGLLPRASIIAVDAFHKTGQDERSDAFTLIRGLDYLAGRGVDVINLSLAGPPNAALEAVIGRLHEDGIVVVASAGNGGPRAKPVYPAGYPTVIAVTAVDKGGRVYRRAAQGDHIDIAAPGVEVWAAASVSGARWKTGTSFATPYVAAAAYLIASQVERPEQVAETLAAASTDLGVPGPDPVYGTGLLDASGLCSASNF